MFSAPRNWWRSFVVLRQLLGDLQQGGLQMHLRELVFWCHWHGLQGEYRHYSRFLQSKLWSPGRGQGITCRSLGISAPDLWWRRHSLLVKLPADVIIGLNLYLDIKQGHPSTGICRGTVSLERGELADAVGHIPEPQGSPLVPRQLAVSIYLLRNNLDLVLLKPREVLSKMLHYYNAPHFIFFTASWYM